MRSFVSMINAPYSNEIENVEFKKFKDNKTLSYKVRAIAIQNIPEGIELLAK